MREHKTFEEFVKRFRELSGLKPDDDPIELLPKQIPAIEYLTEERMKNMNESSLNRIHQHILEHDIATISAWRYKNENCIEYRNGAEKNKIFTRKENDERNSELWAALLKIGYGITHIRGITKEGKQIVQENSYLVVNLKDDINFINNIIKLGKHYCQDSVLLKKKEEENAYIYGTNELKLDKKEIIGKFHPGLENEIMSKIQGRPFYFGEDIDRDGPIQFERYDECSIGGRQFIMIYSKKIIEELNL